LVTYSRIVGSRLLVSLLLSCIVRVTVLLIFCRFDNLKVIYNASTNEYDSPQGVTTDVMDFGGIGGNVCVVIHLFTHN
jgi:hypothetical protein